MTSLKTVKKIIIKTCKLNSWRGSIVVVSKVIISNVIVRDGIMWLGQW